MRSREKFPKLSESLVRAISAYLEHVRLDQGGSPHTVSAYRRDLVQFAGTLGPGRELAAISPPDCEQYLAGLEAQGQAATSRARKSSALRQFFKFCCLELGLENNPAELLGSPKLPKRLPRALTPEEIERLLEASARGLDYPEREREALRIRDRAMVLFLYAAGLRVSELIQLDLKDLDLTSLTVRVRGKGGKERMVPFAKEAAVGIERYLKEVREGFKPRCERVFLGHRGEGLTRQAIFLWLKRLAVLADIPAERVSPHRLRHAFATHLLQAGMGLRTLQMLLGHADLATTQIYTAMSPEHLKETLERYHPRGR